MGFNSTQVDSMRDKLYIDALGKVMRKEMTMAAFAQSLHTMYSIQPQSTEPAPAAVPAPMSHADSRVQEDYYRREYQGYPDRETSGAGRPLFPISHENSAAPQPEEKAEDREATAAYYKQLREFLLPKDTAEESTDGKSEKQGTTANDSPPVKALRNALSNLADYRSVSRSPEGHRKVQIAKKQRSRSRSGSKSKKKKKKKKKHKRRSHSSDSSSSRSRSKSQDRYGKWTGNRKRSRSRSKYRSRSGSRSRSRERRRKRSYSSSSSRGSSYKRSRQSTPDSTSNSRSHGQGKGKISFNYRDEANPSYANVTNEMIENPHVSEPQEVALARKEILLGGRVRTKTMTDIECQLLIDCLQRATTKAEKKEIETLVEQMNRILKPFKKSEILTAQLSGICRFFVKRSERGNFDPEKPYPYTVQKPTARELYPEITSDDIKNYRPTETLRVSEGRLVMLEEKWREGAMTIPLAEKLINMLRKNLTEESMHVERSISKRSLLFKLPWAMLSPNQQTESKLLGVCDYIIATNKERLQSIKQAEAVVAKRSPSKASSAGSQRKSRSRSMSPGHHQRQGSPHRSPVRRHHSPPRRRSRTPPRRRSRTPPRRRSRSRTPPRRRSRTPPRRRSRSRTPPRRRSRTPPMRRSRSRTPSRRRSRSHSRSRRRSRSRSRRRSRSRSRRRSRSRSRRRSRSRSRSRRRSYSPAWRRRRSSSRTRFPTRGHTPPSRPLGISRREFDAMARDDPQKVLRMRKEGKLGKSEVEDALEAIKESLTWQEKSTFKRMMEEGPFVKEYRMSPLERKLTMELEVLCSFLAHLRKRPAETEASEKGPKTIASKALQQVKDQAKRHDIEKQITSQLEIARTVERGSTGVDRMSYKKASLPEGAVGEVIQEIQQQTRLLDAEPRDLPHQMLLMPHENEPDFVARARYAIFLEDRQYGRLNDQQAARVLEDIKLNLPQDEKDLIAKMCSEENKRLVEKDATCMTQSFELTVALKVTCEYFLRRSQKLPHPEDVYPYAHLLGDNDSHMEGLSRNGQYRDIPVVDRSTYRTLDLHECIKALAEQNNVPCSFNVEKVQGSLHNAVVTLGSSTYMGESVTSADEAQQNATYDALLKTYYAFSKIPDLLRNFKHKKDVRRTIVRTVNPLRSAGAMTQILADQNKITKRYKTERDGLMYRATLLLGNKVYKGSGISAEIAQNLADYFAIQQSSYDFTTPPPGVAKGTSGEGFNKVSADPKTLLDNRNSKDSSMGDNLTYLVTEELKQSVKLTSKEYAAINRRIHQLPERIPCDAGCLMAEVERYIEFSSQAQRKKFMNNGRKRVVTYMEAQKMCTVSSILEETKEAHNDVLKILRSPVGEIITPCDKLKAWTSQKRTKELQWTCELIDLKKSGKPITTEWLQAMTPRPRKLPAIIPAEKRKSTSAAKTNPNTTAPEKQVPPQAVNIDKSSSTNTTSTDNQKPKENTIVPKKFPFEMATLPLIPIFEQIKSTVIPVKDRLVLMECRVGQLMNDRKNNKITDLHLMSIINSIKAKLPAKDVQEVDRLTRKAEPELPPGTEISGSNIASKLNHQFKVLTSYVIERLPKQITVVSAARYGEIMARKAAVKDLTGGDPWGIVPPASAKPSGGNPLVQTSSVVKPSATSGVAKPSATNSVVKPSATSSVAKPSVTSSVAKPSGAQTLVTTRTVQSSNASVTSKKTPEAGQPSASKRPLETQDTRNSISKVVTLAQSTVEARGVANVTSTNKRTDSFEVEEQVIQQFCNTVANLESATAISQENKTATTVVPGNTAHVSHEQEMYSEKENIGAVDSGAGGGIIVIEPIGNDDTPMDENYNMNTGTETIGQGSEGSFYSSSEPAGKSLQEIQKDIGPINVGNAIQPSSAKSRVSSTDKRRISVGSDSSSVVEPAMILPSSTDNVSIRIVSKEDGSTELVVQTFKEDDAKGYESATLPWIPVLEPNDLTSVPVEERYRAMKAKVREILSSRDTLKLNTKETTDIMKNIRAKLGKEDLNEVKVLTDEAVKKIPPEAKKAPGPWKMTQRLKVLCQYVLRKLDVPDDEPDITAEINPEERQDTNQTANDGNLGIPSTVENVSTAIPSVSDQVVQLGASTSQAAMTSNPTFSVVRTSTDKGAAETSVDNSTAQGSAEVQDSASHNVHGLGAGSQVSTNQPSIVQAVAGSSQNVPYAGISSQVRPVQIDPISSRTHSFPNVVPSQASHQDTSTSQAQTLPTIASSANIQSVQNIARSSQAPTTQNVTSSSPAQTVQNVVAQSIAHPTTSVKPVAHPTTSASPIAHLTTSVNPVAHPTTSASPIVYPTTSVNPVAHPTSSASPIAHPTTSVNPVAHPTASAKPVAHPTTSAKPVVRPTTSASPTKKLEYPLLTHKMVISKEVAISDEITLPEDPLPWIPELEPNDLTKSSVRERHEAIKFSVMEVLNRRRTLEISDPETSRMIQTVIGRLDKRDVDRLDAVRLKVIKYKGNSPEARPFILTQQLQMICFYIIQRVEKQPETEQKNVVSKWLQAKADEYYTELDLFCLTNSAIKERSQALQLHLTEVQKKSVSGMIIDECAQMKKRFLWDSQVIFLTNVISLELTCLYIQRLGSDSHESLQCTLTKKFAEILMDKKKVSNMDPYDSEDAVRIVKKSLGAESETDKPNETEVVDLETSEHSGPTVRSGPKPRIKLTLSSAKK